MTRIIHAELRKKWGNWLSDQDAKPVKVHYTVMNKVNDDRIVDRAFKQLEKSFARGIDVSGGHFDHEREPESGEGSEDASDSGKNEKLVAEGLVQGLTLWKYDDKSGHWTDPLQFDFQSQAAPHLD